MFRKLASSTGEDAQPPLDLGKPLRNDRMHYNEHGLVDLLEIYHARQLRDQILAQLRRLGVHDPLNPFQDESRRHETSTHYEAMLLTVAELLGGLGDELPLG